MIPTDLNSTNSSTLLMCPKEVDDSSVYIVVFATLIIFTIIAASTLKANPKESYLCFASRNISIGLISYCRNIYHSTHIRFDVGDPVYHDQQYDLSFEKGYKAYYELIGSKQDVYINGVNTKTLIKRTTNLPQKQHSQVEFKTKLQKSFFQLFNTHVDSSYIDNNIKHLKNGVCLGMSIKFIHRYLEERLGDIEFQTAATLSSVSHKNGGSIEVCALQLAQHLIRDVQLSDSLNLYRLSQIQFREFDYISEKECSSLFNGAYFILMGQLQRVSKDSSEITPIAKQQAHVCVLLVEDNQFLIFNPNIGLFRENHPDRYFKNHRTSDLEIHRVRKIQSNKIYDI